MTPILKITKGVLAPTAMAKRRLLLLACCVLLSTIKPLWLLASDQLNSYSLDYINSNSGLPQNSVRALAVDHDGFLWVGTEKGLSRYDGHKFVNFSEVNPDIPEDVLLGLYVDSKNRIWTSWYSHTLRLLLANRTDVLVIKPTKAYPQDLFSQTRKIILEHEDGSAWISGKQHIYRLDADNRVTAFPVDPPAESGGILFDKQIVYGTLNGFLLLDSRTKEIDYVNLPANESPAPQIMGTTWMLTAYDDHLIICHSKGIFRYNPQSKKITRIQIESGYQITQCKQLNTFLLISLVKPKTQQYKIATLDLQGDEIIPNRPGLPITAQLRDAVVDNDGNYWVLLEDSLWVFSGASMDFQAIELPAKSFGAEPNFAFGHSGEAWLRTDGNGIAAYSQYKNRFQTIAPPSSVSPSSKIRGMAEDKDHNVWLVNNETKLLYWNRSRNSWEDRLPGNTEAIKGLEILPDGRVWISIQNLNKVKGFNPAKNAWEHEYHIDQLSPAFTQSYDGRLIAASRNHVVVVDPQTGHIEQVTNETLKGQLRAFQQDQEGNIWVGTHENGLAKVEPSGRVKKWTFENSALTSNEIFSLYIDADGLLWIGTWHGGLLSFDPTTERFTHYGLNEGLPDATVFGILEDNTGHLWLSTYAGLARFKPCNTENTCQPEFMVFDHHDGLQGNEFEADAYFKSDRGEMYFGGMGGFNAFYPENIQINYKPPRVTISRVKLNGALLPGSVSEFTSPDILRLPLGFGELMLEVAVLDFNDPAENRVQYRDSSNGSDWQDMQQPFLLLRSLIDGTHAFQFRGANNDGIWSTQYTGIQIIVAPPLYRHPLMLLLYLLLAVLAPMLYFRRNRARLIARQQALEREVAKRTHELELANESRERFFANVSHEISSPVHMILLLLESHLDAAAEDDRALYQSATGYAAQLMVYLKQLVSGARSHEVDSNLYAAKLGVIIKDLVATNQPIAQTRSVALDVGLLPPERVALYASSAISIFSNLLCNALAYTPEGGEIVIAGEVTGNIYTLAISNTVSEQQATDISYLFERGIRGKFNANYFGGHGLGLSIVTSAVETLNGSIDVALLEDRKILFTVRLPLASSGLPPLADVTDVAFSHEQMLTIKLTGDDASLSMVAKTLISGQSVLIIEDDTQVASLTGQLLAPSFTVYTAGTCRQGIQLVRKHHPDVVLCDLFLPDQSGFEVIKAIRANRMTMDTFIILITASILEADRLEAHKLGVDRFVRKPVSAENLKILINNYQALSVQRFENRQRDKLIRKARISNSSTAQLPFATRFAEVLEELYQDPDTTIENFQTRLSMSYTALMRNCKQSFGKPPKRLLIEKRIEVTKELLISSGNRIGFIAELVGFATHSQFTIVFKKETGITPTRFRNLGSRQTQLGLSE